MSMRLKMWLAKFRRVAARSNSQNASCRSERLRFETLEDRCVPTIVTGTEQSDFIYIFAKSGTSVDVRIGSVTTTYNITDGVLALDAQGGDDTIFTDPLMNVTLTVAGGRHRHSRDIRNSRE